MLNFYRDIRTRKTKPNLVRGQAMLVATIFFLAVAVSVMLGTATPVLRQNRVVENFITARQSYSTAESGLEDVLYRLKNGKQVSATETLIVGNSIATTTILDLGNNERRVDTDGNALNRVRKTSSDVTIKGGVPFNYDMQVGNGGFRLENSASVVGNIYANGPITGTNSNLIKGNIVSSGASGSVSGIHATSSVYAHTISNSIVDGNAYYQVLSNTTVNGTKYSGSADQPLTTLPIPDTLISEWESEAALGGTISSPCPYKITQNITIGPKKINCNLEISGSPTITLTGPIWVAGSINIKNSPTIKVATSLGEKSAVIIADKPSNRSTSSNIELENSAVFQGSGSAGSYVLLVSQNNSVENGGDEDAIEIGNTASGAILLYAGHGNIEIGNNASLKKVSAYRVTIKNSAEVTYAVGLINLLFTSGPSGAWGINSWREE